MMDDLTRNVLEQRDNIENQRNRELNSNREEYIKQLQQENQALKTLLKENQQLKDRINKAVECIEKVLNSYKENPENALGLNIIGLLKILKGDNKEE